MKYTWLMLVLSLFVYRHVTADIQYVGDKDLTEIDKALSGTVASLVLDRINALNDLEKNRTTACTEKQHAIVSECKACRAACRVQVTPEEEQMEQRGAQDAQDMSNLPNIFGSAALEAILGSASKDIDRFGGKNKDLVKAILRTVKKLKLPKKLSDKLEVQSMKTRTGIKKTLKQLGETTRNLLKGSLKWLKNANEKVGKVFKGLGVGLGNVGQRIKDFANKLFTGGFRQPRLPTIGRVIRYDRFGFPAIKLPGIRTPRYSIPSISFPRYSIPRVSFPRYRIPSISVPRYSIPSISFPRYRIPSISIPRYSIPRVSFPRYRIPSISVPRYSIPSISFPRYRIPSISIPRYSIPRISVPRYSIPSISFPRYRIPSISIPRYSIPRISFPSYSAPRFGGGWGGGGGWRGKKRDSSCACGMCGTLEKSGAEIVTKACGENFFQEQNATINEISSLTDLYKFLANTQLIIKISMDLSSLLLTDDGYYANSNMTIQYPEGVEIDMKMIEGMPYSNGLNATRIADVEGPAVYSKLIKV